MGQLSDSGETFKAESETVDLWQLKWNENQIVLVTAIHTLDRDTGLLEGTEAGRWSLGIVEQFQGVPNAMNSREGPQVREPSKCLKGWSYG